MMNRRSFVQGTASAMAGAFLAGGRLDAAASRLQSAGGAGRRQVVVSGRRVKTVDVHAHCVVPGIMELIGQKTPADGPLIMGTERLRQMDAQGIDVEVLSINPFWYSAERELARKLIAMQNEKLSAFCAAHRS